MLPATEHQSLTTKRSFQVNEKRTELAAEIERLATEATNLEAEARALRKKREQLKQDLAVLDSELKAASCASAEKFAAGAANAADTARKQVEGSSAELKDLIKQLSGVIQQGQDYNQRMEAGLAKLEEAKADE